MRIELRKEPKKKNPSPWGCHIIHPASFPHNLHMSDIRALHLFEGGRSLHKTLNRRGGLVRD